MSDYTYRRIITDREGVSTIVKEVNVPDEVVKQIRAEAINDYYNKLNEKINTDTNLKNTIREIHDNVAQEMYCKGVDDLFNEISTYRMYDEYCNVIDLLEIAKQLKENK